MMLSARFEMHNGMRRRQLAKRPTTFKIQPAKVAMPLGTPRAIAAGRVDAVLSLIGRHVPEYRADRTPASAVSQPVEPARAPNAGRP